MEHNEKRGIKRYLLNCIAGGCTSPYTRRYIIGTEQKKYFFNFICMLYRTYNLIYAILITKHRLVVIWLRRILIMHLVTLS